MRKFMTEMDMRPSIERGFTKINVPYLDETLSFAHPYTGPNDYRSVAKDILKNKTPKMSLPNREQTSYLLYAVYCGPEDFQGEDECVELRDEIMKPTYLWIFQRNLWIPENIRTKYGAGVFVVYDEEGVGTSEELDIGKLEKVLKGGKVLKNGIRFSEDEKVGFAPRNTYKEGGMSAEDFANDGFIIVSNKEQGAKNLAEVSQSKYFKYKKLRSWILNPSDEPIQTVSTVGDDWGDDWLDFVGCCVGGRGGYASGVLE